MNAIAHEALRSVASRVALAAGLTLTVLSLACGGAPAGAPTSPSTHSAALTGDAACTGPTTHERHVALFACDTCHGIGGKYGFETPFTFPRGTTTAGGTIVRGTSTTPTTCTVACHFPLGAAPHSVAWNAPAPLACTACHATSTLPAAHPAVAANATRAQCEACHATAGHLGGVIDANAHGADWVDASKPGFHAFSANGGLASCQSCHGQDLSGGSSGVSCASCHDVGLPAGVTSWKTDCVMCHGGTSDQTGAPPAATWGNAGDPARGGGTADPVRVGAHRSHVAAGATAPAFDCSVCHVKPANALAAGHVDGGLPEVTFGGRATVGSTPAWDRATRTCGNTYCHGATLAGGTNTRPVWTAVGQGQATCGTCHGLPPPAPHPSVAGGLAGCITCHPATVAATGALVSPASGGKHLDGIVQATLGSGGGHGASWMDTTSNGFHAYSANASLASCQGCHGVALDGVGGSAKTACASCHGAAWRTTCVACHGGALNATGAPPRGTWGRAADPIAVGAHTKHVTAGAIAGAFDCSVCHVKPADALSAGHANGTATVTWGALAGASGAKPSWSRATGTCASTYCHGGYSGRYDYLVYETLGTVTYAGSNATVSWTGGAMTCASCHGSPPAVGYWHQGHTGGCDLCHPNVDSPGTSILDKTRHVNGIVDVAPRWANSCFNCH